MFRRGGFETRPPGGRPGRPTSPPTYVAMRFDLDRHHRRSIRLPDYDYAQPGAYFVTVCTRARECLLGRVDDSGMFASTYGRIVEECWTDLVNHYAGVKLDAFTVMPNHIHGVIILTEDDSNHPAAIGAGFKPAPAKRRHGLPEIIRGFKAFASRRINEVRDTTGVRLWQRNYYERVIRNESELNAVRQYIRHNPSRWAEDANNPANFPGPKPSLTP